MTWQTRSRKSKERMLEALKARAAERARSSREPYPWQRPHVHEHGWGGICDESCAQLPPLTLRAHDTWLLMGGRGTGKTDATSLYVLDHVNGPPCTTRLRGGHRIAIVAPTLGDAVESSVTGISGLLAYDRRLVMTSGAGGTIVRWPTGARARLYGAHTHDDVNRLRSGGNTCLVVLEEAAAMRYLADVISNAALGLRIGASPHFVAATTPKVRPEIRELVQSSSTYLTRGRTQDAHALDEHVREALLARFEGTRTGRQEMGGELLDEVEGALFTHTLIDAERVTEAPPLRDVVVAIDPNAGGEDECGIVVVGISYEAMSDANGLLVPHVYVLDDVSGHFRHPGQWVRTALEAMRRYDASTIVAEVNNGGNMVPTLIRQVDPSVRVDTVHASDGKAARAEPVVGLYEQRRVHHVLTMPKLEDQMTTWTASAGWSPDRLDALVWGVSHLALPRARRGGRVSAA